MAKIACKVFLLWIGVEIGPPDDIIRRFAELAQEAGRLDDLRQKLNRLMADDVLAARIKKGLWTPESVRERKAEDLTEKQRKLF
ncbi:MAG: hypothetical protein NDI77_05515 [Geobacteraceae bacterium]|nr:hypothetical protein [Geobacteraceae bacterium]